MEPSSLLEQYGSELVLYDRMTQAIAECERVDEVKAIRDRARAIEVYAAQALNYEAESKAAKIRLRAERRCGQLLKEMKEKGERQKPGDAGRAKANNTPKSTDTILAGLGITPDQSSQWQKLAEVPEEKFEARLNTQGGTLKPSTAELIAEPSRRLPDTDEEALFIWGRICDFERHECLERDPHEMFGLMLETMQDDVIRIVPQLIRWLRELSQGRKS